jgi:RNA polymerase sigma-70 factor (ECF subfamily)
MSRPTSRSGTSLAVAVHRGEPGALERLLDEYESPLRSYAESMLRNAFDAQEVVQDAILRAHKALTKQYDEARCSALQLRPWLYRTVRNLALNKHRAKRHTHEEPLDSNHDRAAITGQPDVERRQQAEQLRRAVSRLPDGARELIVLRFIDELSYAEIAKIVGTSEAALRGKVFRALKELRTILEEPTGTARRSR